MATRPPSFQRPANVKLNSSGYGFAVVTCPSGVTWVINRVSASTNAPVPVPGSGAVAIQPVLTIYRDNKPNPAAFVADSHSGNRTSARADETLLPGESLCAEWIGTSAHAGLIATVTISGVYYQGG